MPSPQSKTTTLLFTDLVGYTEMTIRLGGAADELVHTYFDLMRGAVAACGGIEVKTLGDGIMAAFESATAGVNCAVAMQQALDRHNRRSTQPLTVRVGVSVGDTVIERGDYHGVPVIEAARLCSSADGGQILVTDIVRLLVGGGDRERCSPAGDRTLKGLGGPIATWEVKWEPLAELTAVELPSELARYGGSGPFVGRAAELQTLSRAWERSVAGERTAVMITGEPGIGKTRLVAEHARAQHEAGTTVLYGDCDAELRTPFAPFVNVLRHLIAETEADLLGDHVRKHGSALAKLVPELAGRVPDLPAAADADPDTERFRLFEAIDALFEAAAARAPLMLVLDDIHWADQPTLSLLRHLLHGSAAPLMIVSVHRDTQIEQGEPLHDFLAELPRGRAIDSIELSGLAEADTRRLLELAAGRDVGRAGAEFAQELQRETDGNPFFTTELLRHLGDLPRLIESEGWSGLHERAEELPGSIRELVIQRVRRLGADTDRMLQTAAVAGRDFDFALLARTIDLSEDDLIDNLDKARLAGLVGELDDRPGSFFFTHAVIQHALAGEVGATRRQRIHRRLAEALEEVAAQDPQRLGELAHHWIAAGDPVHGGQAAVRAGDQALAVLAPGEAVRWYGRALEVLNQRPDVQEVEHIDLLIKLGDAERRAGLDTFRGHLIDAAVKARRLGDDERLAQAALANNRGMFSRLATVDAVRVDILEAALDATGPADSPTRALLLATLSSELNLSSEGWREYHDRRKELSDLALEIARRLGDERLLTEVIYRRCLTIAEPGTLTERLSLTAELIDLTNRSEDPLWCCLASAERGRVAIEAADLDEALLHAGRQQRMALRSGNAYARHIAAWAEPWPHMLAGRYQEAEAALERALAESMSSRQPDGVSIYGYTLTIIRWAQGRVGELLESMTALPPANELVPAHQAMLVFMLAEADRLDEVVPAVEEATAQRFPVPIDALWLTAMCMWGEACARVENLDGAAILLEHLLPWRDQVAFPGFGAFGSVARSAGVLAGLLGREEADELFALAERTHQRLRAPSLLARTRLDWGAWLLKNGDSARGRRLVEQGHEAAVAFGCASDAQRAEALLA